MKKFIRNILLFVIPIMVGILVLILFPLNKKRAYTYLKDDCDGRGAWIYSRLYESETPVDIAFIGSSQTMNGINDSLIENTSIDQHVCNLGYCRYGRNLQYVLLKHILEAKQPKYVFIEVGEDEQSFGHPIFPYLANGNELFCSPTWKNKTYLDDIYKSAMARITQAQQDLWDEKYEYKYPTKGNHGLYSHPAEADTSLLSTIKKERQSKPLDQHGDEREYAMLFPRAYLQIMSEEAIKYNTKLIFLYIPVYGSPHKIPNEYNTYKKYGEVWIAPDSIYANPSYWHDQGHFNKKGADSFSAWIAGEISRQ